MEPQTPSGPKPPAAPQPPPSEEPWISPRLRDKLGGPDPGAPKEGTPAWVGIVLALLVVGGGTALFLSMRAGATREKQEAEARAEARAAAARADSIASAARMDSMRMVAAAKAAADSALAAKSGRRPAAPPATGAGAATGGAARTAGSPSAPAGKPETDEAPKVVEKGPFGLDVGSFLVEDRAKSEQARLSSATGLKGRVITKSEDGGDSYHVVLGAFATRDAAVKRAESLVARGVVSQAWPVSLAP